MARALRARRARHRAPDGRHPLGRRRGAQGQQAGQGDLGALPPTPDPGLRRQRRGARPLRRPCRRRGLRRIRRQRAAEGRRGPRRDAARHASRHATARGARGPRDPEGTGPEARLRRVRRRAAARRARRLHHRARPQRRPGREERDPRRARLRGRRRRAAASSTTSWRRRISARPERRPDRGLHRARLPGPGGPARRHGRGLRRHRSGGRRGLRARIAGARLRPAARVRATGPRPSSCAPTSSSPRSWPSARRSCRPCARSGRLPDASVGGAFGLSLGEFTALWAAGVLSLEDALIARARARPRHAGGERARCPPA